jgi:hypothetical protein
MESLCELTICIIAASTMCYIWKTTQKCVGCVCVCSIKIVYQVYVAPFVIGVGTHRGILIGHIKYNILLWEIIIICIDNKMFHLEVYAVT